MIYYSCRKIATTSGMINRTDTCCQMVQHRCFYWGLDILVVVYLQFGLFSYSFSYN